MRVTDAAAYNTARRSVMKAHENVATAQEQASSGMRVQKPSDDPVAASAARREASRKALAEAGMSATDQVTTLLDGSDAALADVYENLTQVHELAIESATAGLNAENRTAVAVQVRKIREQMVTLGNTTVAGHFVFAGYRDQGPAFDASGAFIGDPSTKEVQALPGVKVAASIPGDVVFGTGTSEDMFASLDSLIQALESNDPDAVRGTLDSIDANKGRVLKARSQLGAMMDTVQLTHSFADQHSYRAQVEIARLVEVDEIAAATKLVEAHGALQAAISVASQIPTGSLAGGK